MTRLVKINDDIVIKDLIYNMTGKTVVINDYSFMARIKTSSPFHNSIRFYLSNFIIRNKCSHTGDYYFSVEYDKYLNTLKNRIYKRRIYI